METREKQPVRDEENEYFDEYLERDIRDFSNLELAECPKFKIFCFENGLEPTKRQASKHRDFFLRWLLETREKDNILPDDKIRTEEEFFKKVFYYGLVTGGIRFSDKEGLLERYLRPIYNKYMEIIEEEKNNLGDDSPKFVEILKDLNYMLDLVERFASTPTGNIIHSMSDHIKIFSDRDPELSRIANDFFGVIKNILTNN